MTRQNALRAAGIAMAVGLAVAASGCMMARGEYPRPAPTAAAQPAAVSQPMDLSATAATAGPQVGAGGAPARADAGAQPVPMALSNPTATPAATSGQSDQLLTPEEKARLIDELEALAKSQTARASGTKPGCTDDQTVDAQMADPAQALNGDFAAAEC